MIDHMFRKINTYLALSLLAVIFLAFLIAISSKNIDENIVSIPKNKVQNTAAVAESLSSSYGGATGILVAQMWNKQVDQFVLNNPNISGVVLRFDWKVLNPSLNTYSWSKLDAEINRVSAANKDIVICIATGDTTPDYVYSAPYNGEYITLVEAPHNKSSVNVASHKYPIPWNTGVKNATKDFIDALASHLKSNPTLYSRIVEIRAITPLNQSTNETRVPDQDIGPSGTDPYARGAAAWLAKGYTTQKVLDTFKEMYAYNQSKFPTKVIGVAYIGTNEGFPRINDSGTIVSSLSETPNIAERMARYTTQTYGNKSNAATHHLHMTGGTPPWLYEAYEDGAIIGYQLSHLYTGTLPCVNSDTGCTNSEFAKTLNNGINHGATFIEIFPESVVPFAQAIKDAANKLTPEKSDTTPPTAPTNLISSNITSTSATISWTASTDNIGVTGYDIYKDSNLAGSSTTTSFNLSGLNSGTNYTIKIKAKDLAGNSSAYSSSKSITTVSLIDTEKPTAPTNLHALNITNSGYLLSWGPSTDNNGISSYRIYKNNTTLIATPTTTSFQVSGLAPLSKNSYTVRAVDTSNNESLSSNLFSVTTLATADNTLPTAPTNLRVLSSTSTSITIGWDASTDNVGISDYKIFKNSVIHGTSDGNLVYTYTGLIPNTNYYLYVKSVDISGNESALSVAINAKTKASSGANPAGQTPTDTDTEETPSPENTSEENASGEITNPDALKSTEGTFFSRLIQKENGILFFGIIFVTSLVLCVVLYNIFYKEN